ncbi:hypothetical protein BD779DRAFT_1791650 [Infundibulicybe gibba]|nr:hypothetical protein BD779DRAFT_1791650 [Infundibulicybe gibba]
MNGQYLGLLADGFKGIDGPGERAVSQLEEVRDNLRRRLSNASPTDFEWGAQTSVHQILSNLLESMISAPRAYGFVGHISHQDKISATRQARRAHPQAHTTASDRSNTHDNGQDQLAAPHRYDARPSHSYRTLSQLSTYGIAPQHGSARTQYFLTRDPNVPRPTPTATRTNITARASMRPGHLDNVPIR